MAVGDKFKNKDDPRVLIRVGEPGQEGIVEISDVLITGKGPLAGAIYMEWNLHEKENEKGSAAMWEVLFRIGGAKGTDLQLAECDKQIVDNQKCMAGQMMLHVTEHASIYMENMWLWVAGS